MYWIDDTLTISGSSPPTPSTATNPIGWFTEGNPTAGTVPTPVHADWLNSFQSESLNVLAAAGVAAAKTSFVQMLQSIRRLAGANTVAVAANATLTADNAGLVLVNISANVNVTLPAAASAGGTPMKFRLRRADLTAFAVTIGLSGSDTWAPGGVSGSVVLQQSEGADIIGDGVSTWFVNPIGAGYRGISKLTSSGTYVVPPACTTVEAEVWGAGSGSWASVTGICGGGGSGGGYARKLITGLTPGSSITVTVGAGGTAGTTGVAPGAGGASSFGSYISATGGSLNVLNTPAAPIFGNIAGVGSSGDLDLPGGDGGQGGGNQTIAGGTYIGNQGGYGGEGAMAGGVINSGATGNAGRFPGGGASGAGTGTSGTTAYAGAAGAAGYVIVRSM
jgi:hypothetical protein